MNKFKSKMSKIKNYYGQKYQSKKGIPYEVGNKKSP
jgi:hypothetical protein